MRQEAQRWLRQAEADLEGARVSMAGGRYEWACFQAQQAGEKALKAYLYGKGHTSIMTHSLTELVRECRRLEPALSQLVDAAKFLDMFYISTRYPNGLAGSLTPAEFYEKRDAERCLSSSELILTTSKKFIAA